MSDKINIRGVLFDNVTLSEATSLTVEHLAHGDGLFSVFTPNSEIVQLCIEDNGFYPLINSASLVIPDGIGVIKASRILRTPLKEKVAGVELGEAVLKHCAERGIGVFFLGAKPGVADEAAQAMEKKYPGLSVCGTHDGYFEKTGEENDAVIAEVVASGAKVLFVCLGVPAQEKWIDANRARLNGVKVALALGGSLDVYSGNVKRAPKLFIRLGLEWFYRLLKEPKRIGRMMKLPKFYFGTWLYRMKH